MAYFAGVDLGATNVRAAVADGSGAVLGVARRPTPQGPDGDAITETVLDLVREACRSASVHPTTLRAAGVGSIGPLNLAAGAVEDPANLPDAIDRIPLVDPIADLIDSDRVYLHNDATAGVMGERFFSHQHPDDMVYLTVSTGIGAGVAVDGHVLSGWDGNVGEVGHLVVDPEGRQRCGCGHRGHWEAYCSGDNIPGYARSLADRWDVVDTAVPLDDPAFDAADLFSHAPADSFAARVVDRLTHWNAVGVTNLVHAYAPMVVYVGGAVALNNESLVVDPIRERVPEMVMTNVPDIQVTTLGDDVVLRGAIASALTGGTGDRSRLGR
ncbi:ROK family protein [Halobacteriaceae archaeon GCM10025711]